MSGGLRLRAARPVLDTTAVADLHDRLDRARLAAPDTEGWERGVPGAWLAELLADWRAFDVGGLQVRLDGLNHQYADIDGRRVHLVHAIGKGPDPMPLVLTHGWPGSFLEHLELIPRLTDPAAFGGDSGDAFSVVLPSLPGFGFSAPPPAGGLTADVVAGWWHRMMVDGLGYPRYAAHGSDLGAGVTAHLARLHPGAVMGIHLATPGLAAPPRPWSTAEEDYFAAADAWAAEEGGYAHQQATKPATLAAGLLDSPVGLAAWVAEKVIAWSGTTRTGGSTFDRDLLLATLTLYWATGSIATSLLPYWAYRHDPAGALPADDPPAVPTAVTCFGGERVAFPRPPRELADRYFTVTQWREHDVGGHFPAVAEPDLLARTIRDAFRPHRDGPQGRSAPLVS